MDKINDPYKTIRIALILSIVGIIVTATALIFAIVLPTKNAVSFEQAKRYASKLANSELYPQAVGEFERILRDYNLSDREAGSILYQIGDISAEHLRDPGKALAAFIKIQELYPDHPLKDDIERKIIAQLDKMGMSKQAQLRLSETVDPGKQVSETEPSVVVARIGDRAITSDEIEDALADLPPEIAEQLIDPQAKGRFLQDYVGQQLLYDAALRAGYDKHQKTVEMFESARKNILISTYFNDNIANRVEISQSDIGYFYEIHKAEFGDKPLDEIRPQVENALRQQKMAEIHQSVIDELIKTEKVQLFPENLKKTGE